MWNLLEIKITAKTRTQALKLLTSEAQKLSSAKILWRRIHTNSLGSMSDIQGLTELPKDCLLNRSDDWLHWNCPCICSKVYLMRHQTIYLPNDYYFNSIRVWKKIIKSNYPRNLTSVLKFKRKPLVLPVYR
jgi:hypothetical protein